MILGKYNQAKTIKFSLVAPDGVDLIIAATFAAGDIKISKDEGAEVNTVNLPTDEGTGYSLVLTATEMSAARISLYIIDQTATKIWLDIPVEIETYGNASAEHAFDLDTAAETMRGTDNALLAASINLTGGAVDTVTTLTNKTGFSLAATGLDLITSTATGVVEIAKAIWDRVLSAANHNIANSAGRRVRAISAVPFLEGTVNDATATSTVFETTLTGYGDSFFSDSLIMVEIAADQWQGRPVASYASATGEITLDEALISAPANGVNIAIQSTHIHPVTEIQAGLATEAKQDIIDANVDLVLEDTSDIPTVAEFEARTPTAAELAYITRHAATALPVTFTGGTTTTAILGNVDGVAASSTDDVYNSRLLVFNAGTLNVQVCQITDYNGTTKTATISAVTTAVTSSHTAVLV